MNYQVRKLSRAIGQLAQQQKSAPSSLVNRKISSLRKRVIRLSRNLRVYASQSTVKTLLALAAAVLAGSSTAALAQQFAAPIENPFGIEINPNAPDEDIILPSFGDIDGDGDLDMLSVSYDSNSIIFQENIGSPTAPAFGSRQLNPFGIIMPNDVYYAHPTLVDIDTDGDLDLLSQFDGYSVDSIGSFRSYFGILYSENKGTIVAPSFEDTTRIIVNGVEDFFLGVELVDIDGDSDLDLIGSGSYEDEFTFVKNTALPGALPSFGTVQEMPFGLTSQEDQYEFISFGDLDQDGDLDMLSHSYIDSYNGPVTTDFVYRENVGSRTLPQFAAPVLNPFGLSAINDEYIGVPELVDIDSDGDLDLFLLTYSDDSEAYKIKFFENTAAVSTREVTTTAVEVFPNPATSQLTIQSAGVIEQMKVINTLGVAHDLEVHGNNQVNIQHLPKGTYTILATQTDGVRLHAKLLKQ